MGFIQFESVEHANKVADLLGYDRPYTDRIESETDSSLDTVKNALAMAKDVSDMTGDKATTSELLDKSGLSQNSFPFES